MLCCMTFPKQLPLRFFDNWLFFPEYYLQLFVSFVYLKTINSFLTKSPQLYKNQIYHVLIKCMFSKMQRFLKEPKFLFPLISQN